MKIIDKEASAIRGMEIDFSTGVYYALAQFRSFATRKKTGMNLNDDTFV